MRWLGTALFVFCCGSSYSRPSFRRGRAECPEAFRKRGPRSWNARQRRFTRIVHITNSLHVSSTTSTSSTNVPLTAVVPAVSPSVSLLDFPKDTSTTPTSSNVHLPDGFSSSFSVLHVNIRGWRSHVDELTAYVQLLDKKPSVIVVNETFLNKAVSVHFPGYVVAGRRDRFCPDTSAHVDCLQPWDGVLVFVARKLDGFVLQF